MFDIKNGIEKSTIQFIFKIIIYFFTRVVF